VLWSQLYLSKGETYVKTLLERAKGSSLTITTNSRHPVGTVTLLSPLTDQLKCIYFEHSHWKDIQRFSEINFGPLPLLHTLSIRTVDESNLDGPNVMTPPSLPLFRNAINLKRLFLSSEGLPFLNHFVLPNLTVLELSATPEMEGFRASQLLDFLEASPMLEMVHMDFIGDILLEGIPRERAVVLPNVVAFTLIVEDGGPGYEIAARISCPSAMYTTLVYQGDAHSATPQEMFPSSVLWNAIVHKYTKNPVEEVEFKIAFSRSSIAECSLTFRSPGPAVLNLRFQLISGDDDDEDEPQIPFEELHYEIFHQASRTIRDYPFLANVKRLHIDHNFPVFPTPQFPGFSVEVGRLFESVGPLEKLTTHGCDLRLYLNPSPNPPGSPNTERLVVFPQIRELVISHPSHPHNGERCMATILELARSRHAPGIPFERMTVRMKRLPTVMVEKLRPWVSVVECHEVRSDDGY